MQPASNLRPFVVERGLKVTHTKAGHQKHQVSIPTADLPFAIAHRQRRQPTAGPSQVAVGWRSRLHNVVRHQEDHVSKPPLTCLLPLLTGNATSRQQALHRWWWAGDKQIKAAQRSQTPRRPRLKTTADLLIATAYRQRHQPTAGPS